MVFLLYYTKGSIKMKIYLWKDQKNHFLSYCMLRIIGG